MNEYEKALLKSQKREQRKILTLPKPEPKPEPLKLEVITKEKEEKPSDVGLIHVRVTLPNGVIEFTLKKDAVLQNAPLNKLNQPNIERAVREGLAPIFGEFK